MKLALGAFGRTGIEMHAGGEVAATVAAALDHYVRQLGAGRAIVRYPRFRRGPAMASEWVEMDPAPTRAGTMAALEREADKQNVAVEQLAEHALLVYLADLSRPI